MALISAVSGPTDYRHIAPARRSAGYYGNSHIFQGGDNLRDPHAAGDEHHHYIGRQAAARGVEARKRAYQAAVQPVVHIPDEGEPHIDNVVGGGAAAAKRLKSATLAEQARIQQLQAEQRVIEGVRHVGEDGGSAPLPIKHVEHAPVAGNEGAKAATAGKQKRPIMPFDKLADKKKAVPAAQGAAIPPRKKELPSTPELDVVEDQFIPSESVASGGQMHLTGEAVGSAKEYELTDREQIAELRKKAAARRLAKKAAAEGKVAAEEGREPVKAERPGAKLGLVARKKRAQIQQEEGKEGNVEVSAVL